MRSARRVTAAIVVALLCAPGTFIRSDVSWAPPDILTVERVQGPSETIDPAWRVEGVWRYSADSPLFGGFSALLALPSNRFEAFSDRGARFSFAAPESAGGMPEVERQRLALKDAFAVPDIEAATRDPSNGRYWLAVEDRHTIYRFGPDHKGEGARLLDGAALGWTANAGAEAMQRLDDGRFVILPEGRRTGLIFDGDPVADGTYRTFSYLPPAPGFGATDFAQLPDGRILLLVRSLDPLGGLPPFAAKIAIGAPPRVSGEVWAPEITLDLAGVLPRENYEGIAVRPRDDARLDVWLISDDNLSALQRTLVAKLVFDPRTQ